MSSWKTLLHKNAIKIVWGVKSVVLLTKIQALFGEKNLGAFFGAFWLIWGASWFKHFSHPAVTAIFVKSRSVEVFLEVLRILNYFINIKKQIGKHIFKKLHNFFNTEKRNYETNLAVLPIFQNNFF